MPESATIRYAKAFYDVLMERSQETIDDEGQLIRVFAGRLGSAWSQVGASNSYYSKVRGLLQENGCIKIEHQGVKNKNSIVLLLKPPQNIYESPLTPGEPPATISGMEARVAALEARLGPGLNVREALRDMELRLSKLEQVVGQTTGMEL